MAVQELHCKAELNKSVSHEVRKVGILHVFSDVPTNIFIIIYTWDNDA